MRSPQSSMAPSVWVKRFLPLIKPGGLVLDLAAGSGRHVRLLRECGFTVCAVDRDTAALLAFAGPYCEVRRTDLETDDDYLIRLAQGLKDRGANELSKIATDASRQAASMSAGFLGGSRIALRRMLSEGKTVFEPSEQADIEDVLQQLTAAINRWSQKKD